MRFRLAATLFLGIAGVWAAACGGSPDKTPDTPSPSSEPATTVASATAPGTPSPSASPHPPRTGLGTPSGIAHTTRAPDFVAIEGATARFGTLDGATFRIEVPRNWNGGLVLFAHGIRLTGTEVFVSNPPQALRQAIIRDGYAWAASSFRENFYVPGIGADDTLALLEYVRKEVGEPRVVYLVGESMGGHVVTLLLEHHPERFDGALSLCGAVAGQDQIDFLVSWLALAEAVTGVTVPLDQGQAAIAVPLLQTLPGALGSPPNLTPAGQRFASAILALTGGPRAFFAQGLALQLQPNFGLFLLDPKRSRLASAAATNAGVTYRLDESLGMTSADLNAKARRFAADPAARNPAAHPDAVPTTGKISTRLLTLHNTGDLFVPISMEQEYRRRVDAAGQSKFLVQRAIKAAGHCQFSPQELTQAWTDLVAWVEKGVTPAGDDLLGDLSSAGDAFTNPARDSSGTLP